MKQVRRLSVGGQHNKIPVVEYLSMPGQVQHQVVIDASVRTHAKIA
jgi:hypothetical protein